MKGLVLLAVGAATVPFNGLVLMKLWGWFIVPTLHAPLLGIAQAIGVATVVSFMTAQYAGKDERATSEIVIYCAVKPLIALAFGWAVTLFL